MKYDTEDTVTAYLKRHCPYFQLRPNKVYQFNGEFHFYSLNEMETNDHTHFEALTALDSLCSNNAYFFFFDKKGRLIEEGFWFPEFFYGLYRSYYKSGQIKSEGYAGVKDLITGNMGQWIYYYKNGQIKSEGEYWLGEKTGVWKYYKKNGSLKKEIDYGENTR